MVEKGPKEALGFFDSLQPLLMEHLDPQGFSLSLEDLSMSREDMGVIHNLIIREISPMVSRLRLSYEDELQLENSIHKVKEVAANFMLKSYSMRNLIDIKSNSAINKLVQQIGFLGLQLSDKKKLYTKTLVEDMAQFYKKNCGKGGHCPLFKGLAEPGTLFKNLMAVLRDIVITNDGTVRNTCSNSIVQFKYELSSDNENQGLFEAETLLEYWQLPPCQILPIKRKFYYAKSTSRTLPMIGVILYLNECRCGKSFARKILLTQLGTS
ncbi:hypothetical protein Bca52824_042912 [Brassica carinata]|uniref:DNA-directed RNA polymerase n=1 Tax=Brassica carinata TaxID=52824 RepID=A0A8X7RVN5_BRACI|nr:hypothetical protein Bca52824_042912 [Brassica carinata]